MLTALRREVQALLAAIPADRKPALRRSDDASALLATDLPLIARDDAVNAFIAAAQADGWTVTFGKGWLLLDHAVPVPEVQVPPVIQGEAGCCLSLLLRHPGEDAPKTYIRALVKADEAGKAYLERLCAQWHRDFAGMLRRHEPLPGGLTPYLCAAIHHHTEKEVAP